MGVSPEGVTSPSLSFLRQPLSQRAGKRALGGNTWEALSSFRGFRSCSVNVNRCCGCCLSLGFQVQPNPRRPQHSCAHCPASCRGVEGLARNPRGNGWVRNAGAGFHPCCPRCLPLKQSQWVRQVCVSLCVTLEPDNRGPVREDSAKQCQELLSLELL